MQTRHSIRVDVKVLPDQLPKQFVRADPGARQRQAARGRFPEVARTIHGHPTRSEAVMEAGRALDGWLIDG